MQRVRRFLAGSLFVVALSAAAALPASASLPPRDRQSAPPVGVQSATLNDLPSAAEQTRMIGETISIFARSVTAGSMAALYEHASAVVRSKLSPEQLDRSFQPFIPVASRIAAVTRLTPVITGPARAFGKDTLMIEGFYPLDLQMLSFRVTYVREGLDWRWANLHVQLVPSVGKPAM